MKPTRIRATGFGPFADLDVSLSDGATVVLGELLNAPEGADSNGAGKSTLLNAIPVALFGAPKGFSSLAEFVTHGQDTLMLELTFAHLGETYRVRRGYSARGRGKSTLDLEVLTMTSAKDPEGLWDDAGEQWRPLTLASAKETQALIETTISQTEEMFRRSAFLEQGARSFAHPDIKPAERKDLIAGALQLGVWQRLWDEIEKPRKRRAEQELAAIAARVEPVEERLAARPELESQHATMTATLTDARALAAAARLLLEAESNRAVELDQAEATWNVRNSAVQAASARFAAHMRLQIRETEYRKQVALACEELADVGPAEDVAPLEQQEQDLVAAQQAYAAALASRDVALALTRERTAEKQRLVDAAGEKAVASNARMARADEVEQAPPGTEVCDHCGQSLDRDAASKAAFELRAEATRLAAEELELRVKATAIDIPIVADLLDQPENAPDPEMLSRLRTRLTRTRENNQRVATLQERIAGFERTIAETDTPEFHEEKERLEREVEQATSALKEFPEPEPGAADEARSKAVAAKITAQAEEKRADTAVAAIERTKLLLEQLDALQAQVAGDVAERDRLNAELDLLAHLDQVYGRDGVPAFVVDNVAVPLIEHETNQLLARVGMSYRIAIRSERVTQAGDVAGALDVQLLLNDGSERPYSRLSGGEASRVLVALQHGMTQLLKRRRSADVEMFVLDEPPFLDKSGQRAIAETLQELTADYPIVMVVSHDDELRDAFDQAIVVGKDCLTGVATVTS